MVRTMKTKAKATNISKEYIRRMAHLHALILDKYGSIKAFNLAIGRKPYTGTVANLISGACTPSYTLAQTIAQALDVQVEALWPDISKPVRDRYLILDTYISLKESKGFSDRLLAEALKLPSSYNRMKSWKRGNGMTLEEATRLANVLGIPVDTITSTVRTPDNEERYKEYCDRQRQYKWVKRHIPTAPTGIVLYKQGYKYRIPWGLHFEAGCHYKFEPHIPDLRFCNDNVLHLQFVKTISPCDGMESHKKFQFISPQGFTETFTYPQLGDVKITPIE